MIRYLHCVAWEIIITHLLWWIWRIIWNSFLHRWNCLFILLWRNFLWPENTKLWFWLNIWDLLLIILVHHIASILLVREIFVNRWANEEFWTYFLSIVEWNSILGLGVRWWLHACHRLTRWIHVLWIVRWNSWIPTLIDKTACILPLVTYFGSWIPRLILLHLKPRISLSHWVLLINRLIAAFLLFIVKTHVLNRWHYLWNINFLCLNTLLS